MIGERLKQARLGAGLSMDALVARMDHALTKQAISKYETGKSVPRPDVLLRLAGVLGVRTSYFMEEPQVAVELIAYRKHARLPRAEENRLRGRIMDHLERFVWLIDLFPSDRDAERGSTLGARKPSQVTSFGDAEKVAKELRNEWSVGLDAIDNLTEMLEDHGAAVLALDADERFACHSAWMTVLYGHERRIPVFVCNAVMPGDRQRFSLAHELGHLVVKQRQTKEDEEIAHRFAAAFLVPDEAAYHELGRSRSRIELDELLLLKHKYGFSMQAWLRRARDLGIVTPSWYKNAIVAFRKRGWHKREPGTKVPAERPSRFKQLVLRAVAEGIISRERAEELQAGAMSLSREEQDMPETKKIAARPLEERRKLLEAAAKNALRDYQVDKDLTAFTQLDGAMGD